MKIYKSRTPQSSSGFAAEKNITVRSYRNLTRTRICLALIFTTSSGISFGQTSGAALIPSTDNPVAAQTSRNPFGENLKPKVKRTAASSQAYNPIRKQDDQAEVLEIEMFVGESRVFPTPGVARIAVGNGTIMSATALDSKEVLIFANGIGTSSLFVWNEDGRYQRVKVHIVPGDTSRFSREIAAFLAAIPNAKASVIGDKVIVEGDNLADLDIAKIDELAKRYPQIVNFTNRLGWEQMVLMDVKVVEFPTNELSEIGIRWNTLGGAVVGGVLQPLSRGKDGPYQINLQTGTNNPAPITGIGGGSFPLPGGLNLLSLINVGLNAQLNLLEQNGKATLLAQPQLSARNGSKATFLSGGEFPYTVATINGTTVLFKSYGIRLDITPRVDRTGVIRASIDSEVSTIDGSISTPSGPALLTRRTTTEFNVRNGETIVLSGLISREVSKNIDKLPFLGDIPILGALFRSTRYQNRETELVVFVTPTIVDSRTPGQVDRVERTTERLEKNLGKPPFLTDPLQPKEAPVKVDKVSSASTVEDTDKRVDQQPGEAGKVFANPDPVSPNPNLAALIPPNLPIKQAKAPASKVAGMLQVAMNGLPVREKPNSESRMLMQLNYGSIVRIGKLVTQSSSTNKWRNVMLGEVSGWVSERWLKPIDTEPNTVASNGAAARPDQQNGHLGKSNTATKSALPVGNTDEEAAGKTYRVKPNWLALRLAPDIDAPLIEQLSSGKTVQALSQAPSGDWLAVQVDGKRGWVAAQWLAEE